MLYTKQLLTEMIESLNVTIAETELRKQKCDQECEKVNDELELLRKKARDYESSLQYMVK